jgi:hypothetical protein
MCCPQGSFGDPIDFSCKLPLNITQGAGVKFSLQLNITVANPEL